MSKELFGSIADAIDIVMSRHSLKTIVKYRQNVWYVENQFIAFCWSMFHISKFDYKTLYDAGLNDSHIETALKRILSDFE